MLGMHTQLLHLGHERLPAAHFLTLCLFVFLTMQLISATVVRDIKGGYVHTFNAFKQNIQVNFLGQ
jgi:hypothetical protein